MSRFRLSNVSDNREFEKVFSGHQELLDGGLCDVLVVSTPNMTHYQILMDIINHPRPHHVLVEKPLCTTVAHCKEVIPFFAIICSFTVKTSAISALFSLCRECLIQLLRVGQLIEL